MLPFSAKPTQNVCFIGVDTEGCKHRLRPPFSTSTYPRNDQKVFLESFIRDAVTYTQNPKRKTVTVMDVFYTLKRQGRTWYGFGG
uniref:Histone H4 n=1 Tax=Megaselia scalaris TaxID=36166 RepID=T1H163_MEGSC